MLLLFVLTTVYAITNIEKTGVANESRGAKVKLLDEDKIGFHIIMDFIIIMMICDCFPGKKCQYL